MPFVFKTQQKLHQVNFNFKNLMLFVTVHFKEKIYRMLHLCFAGLTAAQDCTPCDAGMYCQGTNLTQPTDVCSPGYYCISGVDKPDPLMIDENQCPTNSVHPIIGHICPLGHFCEAGTVYPEGKKDQRSFNKEKLNTS